MTLSLHSFPQRVVNWPHLQQLQLLPREPQSRIAEQLGVWSQFSEARFGDWRTRVNMGVSKNMGKPPNHPFVHMLFPLFSASILGFWNPLFLVQHPHESTNLNQETSDTVGFNKYYTQHGDSVYQVDLAADSVPPQKLLCSWPCCLARDFVRALRVPNRMVFAEAAQFVWDFYNNFQIWPTNCIKLPEGAWSANAVGGTTFSPSVIFFFEFGCCNGTRMWLFVWGNFGEHCIEHL